MHYARRVRAAVPHAGLLPDLRPVPGAPHRPRLADYLDRKVLHFAYFYVLWLTIQFAFKAPALPPRGLARRRPALSRGLHRAVRHAVVHLSAADLLRRHQAHAERAVAGRSGSSRAALEIAHIDTGWMVIDEFAAPLRLLLHRLRASRPHIFALRRGVQRAAVRSRCRPGALGRCSMALLVFAGYADLPFVSLALGLVGAAAVVAVATLMAQTRLFAAAALSAASIRSSSISPSSCRWRRPARAAQDRHHRRRRHDRRCSSRSPASSARSPVLGGARTRRSRFLFERPGLGAAQAPQAALALQPAE